MKLRSTVTLILLNKSSNRQALNLVNECKNLRKISGCRFTFPVKFTQLVINMVRNFFLFSSRNINGSLMQLDFLMIGLFLQGIGTEPLHPNRIISWVLRNEK